VPTHKTQADTASVQAFVRQAFSKDAGVLVPLKGGELSQAYRFEARGAMWVIRVNPRKGGFEKDAFAHRQFASEIVPIPRTVLIDEMPGGLFASITAWIEGVAMDRLSGKGLLQLMPDFLAVLDAVHESDTSFDSNFGYWGATGHARHASWRDHLSDSLDRYRNSYRETFPRTHPAWAVFRAAEDRIGALLPCCPEQHELVHGDVGFDNTLVRDGKVVGVIDWDRAAYGDRLSDVAWLSLWLDGVDIGARFLDHYRATGFDIDHYHERIACYALLYGVDALRFYASGDRPDDYRWAKGRVETFLD
jgi:hygromycin-B 4-O-kinase